MRGFRLATLAACFLASSATAAPFPGSSAGPRVAAGSGIVPYQAYSDKPKCQLSTTCIITFPAVTNSGAIVQRVSCAFAIKTGGSFALSFLTISGQTAFNILSANKSAALTSGGVIYTIDQATNLFVDTAQQPEVTISSLDKGIKDLACTITGVYI
jgi:hypothetical protein